MILAGIISELWQQVSLTRTLIQHTILGLAARTVQAVTRAAIVRLGFYDAPDRPGVCSTCLSNG
jgi:hypothetical protein